MISAPEDYGLTPEQTYAHRCVTKRPEDFDAYWAAWREELLSLKPYMTGSIEPGVNEVVFRSMGVVRIVGQLLMPEAPPAGAVVTLHGYGGAGGTFPATPPKWDDKRLITVRLRVRGYPPSTLDVPDWREGWIVRGIERTAAWVVRGAVADVVQACRCLHKRFGGALPITLHGESLGGGLAVMAAAQLEAMDESAHRLVVGLPTLGDWDWRRDRYCNGSGGEVNRLLDALRLEAEPVRRTLRLHDAALHAADVTSATLAKLAARDDVVPAPAAAAVINALAAEPSLRWYVACGHFDGGLADTRRHAQFDRLAAAFVDPAIPVDDVAAACAVGSPTTTSEPPVDRSRP